jgi:hypothetical protein
LFADMLSLPNEGRYPTLDLTPEQRRQRTLEALISQVEKLTHQGLVLMVFEDAHWSDPTSLEVLGRIVDRIRSLPVLLLVTFRPEFDPPWLRAIAELNEVEKGLLKAAPPAATSSTPQDAAERRQVTVMFSDLVGSTALAARMDPEDLREIISAYQKCVAETVRRFGGFVAKYLGDGVLVYFGYPQAHEDDAERAVRAALELVTTVNALKTHAPLANPRRHCDRHGGCRRLGRLGRGTRARHRRRDTEPRGTIARHR